MRFNLFPARSESALEDEAAAARKTALTHAGPGGFAHTWGSKEYAGYAAAEAKVSAKELEIFTDTREREAGEILRESAKQYANVRFDHDVNPHTAVSKYIESDAGSIESLMNLAKASPEDIGSLQVRYMLPTLSRIIADDWKELGFESKQEAKDKLEQASLTVRMMDPDVATTLLARTGLIAVGDNPDDSPTLEGRDVKPLLQDYTTRFIAEGKFRDIHYPQSMEGPDIAQRRERLAQMLVPYMNMIWKLEELFEVAGDRKRIERLDKDQYDIAESEKLRFSPLGSVLKAEFMKGRQAATEEIDPVVLGLLNASLDIAKDLWHIKKTANAVSRHIAEKKSHVEKNS